MNSVRESVLRVWVELFLFDLWHRISREVSQVQWTSLHRLQLVEPEGVLLLLQLHVLHVTEVVAVLVRVYRLDVHVCIVQVLNIIIGRCIYEDRLVFVQQVMRWMRLLLRSYQLHFSLCSFVLW